MSAGDEEVVSPDGEVCTVKDCCVVICEGTPPAPNPGRGALTDRTVIDPAFDAVCKSVESAYGLPNAERVAEVLYALPIVYNPRLSRAIGRAKFVYDRGLPVAQVIELTGSVDIPTDYMHGLLVHEGCHVAHAVLAQGAFSYEEAHGSRWQQLMVGAGQKPAARCSDPRLVNVEQQRVKAERSRMRRGGPQVALKAEDFNVGDIVSFEFKRERWLGRITQKTPTFAYIEAVENRHLKWRIGYGLLTKEPSP